MTTSKTISIGRSKIELVIGDITDQSTDAIVNAANAALAGGGGVDGAIHRRGGPSIMAETNQKYPGGCPTGSAVVTSAGDLHTRYILHAVGPIYTGGHQQEAALLASAYRACLELADELELASISFPALSAGAYRYPLEEAAQIAVQVVSTYLSDHPRQWIVRFVLFNQETYDAFSNIEVE